MILFWVYCKMNINEVNSGLGLILLRMKGLIVLGIILSLIICCEKKETSGPPPAQPINLMPFNNDTIIGSRINFKWRSFEQNKDEISYDFHFLV